MKKKPLAVMIGAALLAAPTTANAHYRDGAFYVHKKEVSITPVEQICCNPVVTYYQIKWGNTKTGLVSFKCRYPNAVVAGAEPSANDPRNAHKGRAWFYGCAGTIHATVEAHRLRD